MPSNKLILYHKVHKDKSDNIYLREIQTKGTTKDKLTDLDV